MLGEFNDFVFSDLLGVKFDAKTDDLVGNLKVFVLGVGCLGWVVWEGKYMWYASVLSRIFMGQC